LDFAILVGIMAPVLTTNTEPNQVEPLQSSYGVLAKERRYSDPSTTVRGNMHVFRHRHRQLESPAKLCASTEYLIDWQPFRMAV